MKKNSKIKYPRTQKTEQKSAKANELFYLHQKECYKYSLS